MSPSLCTECCQVGQQKSPEHSNRKAFIASAGDILVVHFLFLVFWQQMKLMFQKVEELLVVVDESDVDTKDEQYCNEDVE